MSEKPNGSKPLSPISEPNMMRMSMGMSMMINMMMMMIPSSLEGASRNGNALLLALRLVDDDLAVLMDALNPKAVVVISVMMMMMLVMMMVMVMMMMVMMIIIM